MDLRWSDESSEARFAAYVEVLSRALGHADRVGPFRSYCTGLLLPGARKSVEPMAARSRSERSPSTKATNSTIRKPVRAMSASLVSGQD